MHWRAVAVMPLDSVLVRATVLTYGLRKRGHGASTFLATIHQAMDDRQSATISARFPVTRWTMVTAAQGQGRPAHLARNELCGLYWPPVYAFVRRKGKAPTDAEDITKASSPTSCHAVPSNRWQPKRAAYDEIAARHGLTAGAVKAAAHRLRQGFRAALRRAVAETVTCEEEIDDEIQHLFSVFQTP